MGKVDEHKNYRRNMRFHKAHIMTSTRLDFTLNPLSMLLCAVSVNALLTKAWLI